MKDNITEKVIKEDVLIEQKLDYKIEIAAQTLDRNINFITNCDNKTSIVLATFGVLLTIILTNEGLNELFNIIKTCILYKNFCNIFYLICLGITIILTVFGMISLGNVLIARTSDETIGTKDSYSRIFFAGIKRSGNYSTYKQSFLTMNKEDILNDVIEQIYVNADIAVVKYKYYNRGLRYATIGFVLFIIFLLIGNYLY